MSKKLTATLVLDFVAGLLAALNTTLGLNVPVEVLTAFAASAGAATVWYLQKQGVIDVKKAGAVLLLPLLLLAGCGSIARDYVDADELTLNAISPEYRRYVENDPTMSEDDKNLRYANLDSWAYRVEQAKKAGDK